MFYRKIDDHLSLKLSTIMDAEELFAIVDRNRDYLRPWLPWVDTTLTVEDERSYLRFALTSYAELKVIHTGLLLDGVMIGSIGLHTIDREVGTGEIGYWIDKDHEGKGYVTVGVREMERLGFLDMGLGVIVITNDVDNVRSRAIPERLGYTLDGVWRHSIACGEGRVADRSIYTLLKSEWEAREAAL